MSYNQQVAKLAKKMLCAGEAPDSLVHICQYPTDYYLFDKEPQALSTPLPADTNMSGYTGRYYTLAELSQW